jgi:hypothetical protein
MRFSRSQSSTHRGVGGSLHPSPPSTGPLRVAGRAHPSALAREGGEQRAAWTLPTGPSAPHEAPELHHEARVRRVRPGRSPRARALTTRPASTCSTRAAWTHATRPQRSPRGARPTHAPGRAPVDVARVQPAWMLATGPGTTRHTLKVDRVRPAWTLATRPQRSPRGPRRRVRSGLSPRAARRLAGLVPGIRGTKKGPNRADASGRVWTLRGADFQRETEGSAVFQNGRL